MAEQCPGSKFIRDPQPEDITCPWCKVAVEIWTDETRTRCRNCGHVVVREMTQSCLDWCVKAKECLGRPNDEDVGH
jgi:hypothetical protein